MTLIANTLKLFFGAILVGMGLMLGAGLVYVLAQIAMLWHVGLI